jgi:hypothetical protein
MINLRIFGSPIHDTALVFIVTSTLLSLLFNYISELGRFEANITVLSGAIVAFLYWFTQYRVKK